MPFLFAAALACISIPSPHLADSKKLSLRWHGQSFFVVETSQRTRIVFDPHAIEAYGRNVVPGDLVLLSHLHNDHTQVDAVDNPKKKIINGLTATGRKVEWNPVDEKF